MRGDTAESSIKKYANLYNRFGVGIYLYFDYLVYLIGTNIVLLILGIHALIFFQLYKLI